MKITRTRLSLAATLLFLLGGAGCTVTNKYSSVTMARSMLLGFTKDDVIMCAGFPTRTRVNGDTEIWSYEYKDQAGGATLTAPLVLGMATPTLNYSAGGGCKMQVLFVDDRVRRLAYAGDNDSAAGRDMLCTPIVDDCINYANENTRILAHRRAQMSAIDRQTMVGAIAKPENATDEEGAQSSEGAAAARTNDREPADENHQDGEDHPGADR
ncbi:hypothetical protein [Consotaella salsifontis]|uniref:Uncharacterized protein n=1 Tax=Consotaella salsifontis TaxID=1365950 RepID=A0A1T4L1E9_9HYPH|nr:hypothetical protein [Consotaella salsifontis]SJZ48535.1 hypothetical protein SAMN05428963_10113 [Consotaella salsifontis]